MRKKGLSAIMMIASALMMVGCANTPDPRKELSARDGDPAVARLAASAENIQRYWNDVAAIESAQYQKQHPTSALGYDARYVPGLEKIISLGDSWHGPIEPLIKEVAGLVGYEVTVFGTKPAADVIVNIDTSYRRAIDILADSGYQAGKRAEVKVLAKESVIEVRYAKY